MYYIKSTPLVNRWLVKNTNNGGKDGESPGT